jgi:hypothetical protein
MLHSAQAVYSYRLSEPIAIFQARVPPELDYNAISLQTSLVKIPELAKRVASC